jgi:hypothetical protein
MFDCGENSGGRSDAIVVPRGAKTASTTQTNADSANTCTNRRPKERLMFKTSAV